MKQKKILSSLLVAILSTGLISSCSKQNTPQTKDATETKRLTAEEQAFQNLTKKAEAGDASAQFELGNHYDKGQQAPKDLTKALEWWIKSANQNNKDAQLVVGRAYLTGMNGYPKDESKAISFLQQSAESGNLEAQYRLGQAYSAGKGVIKDDTKAIDYWKKSAELGFALSQIALGKAYYNGANGLPIDLILANTWIEKAISLNDPSANASLALSYLTGYRNFPKDAKKSYELATKSANMGNTQAKSYLCHLYTDIQSLALEKTNRASWCLKGAEANDPDSQFEVGLMYRRGSELPLDDTKAFEFFSKAAIQGHVESQHHLGNIYASGKGVESDLVLAFIWYNLSASSVNVADLYNGTSEKSKRLRDSIAQMLSPNELKEAQQLSSNWKPGQPLERTGNPSASTEKPGSYSKRSTGTAFIISKTGHAITNNHVVEGCKELKISGKDTSVKLITSDAVNDLSLINVGYEPSAIAAIASDPNKLRQGEDIVVFGYPLNSLLSSGGNLTPGIVSAITGLGNNTNQIQITAPIQPGSSGSPVMNKKSEVVAVVSMKLDDVKMAKSTGSVGQNVNFAVSGQTLKSFLDANKLEYKKASMISFEKSTADIAEEAKQWTTVVECWK